MANQDNHYMKRCLELAERGAGRTSPNPMVGCVIVRSGEVIAEGWHQRFGGAHAEVEALRKAGLRAKGSTLYVNLEPCCHWGKTPPCTDAIIKASVKQVVTALKDPNPLVAGKGLMQLKRHGVRTRVGVLSEDAGRLNRAFIKWIHTGLPYVTLKAAMTLDGKISTQSGESRWISGVRSRAWVHALRSHVDAVAVGAGTVIHDNPRLTSHGHGKNPLRIVIDGRLNVGPSARIFNKEAPTLVATTKEAPQNKMKLLERRGTSIFTLPAHSGATINLKELLKTLGKMSIEHLLVEGGGELNASFVEEKLVDEIILFVAPAVFGGRGARTPVEGEGVSSPAKAWRLEWGSITKIGNDLMIRAKPTLTRPSAILSRSRERGRG